MHCRWTPKGRRTALIIIAVAAPVLAVGARRVHHEYLKRFVYVRAFDSVVPGVLYRGKPPNADTWDRLHRCGVTTIVDLRLRSDAPESYDTEGELARAEDVRLVRMPFNASAPIDSHMQQFLTLVQANEGAVLVHCQHGRSRTGMFVAAYRVVVQGWTVEQAIGEMRCYGWGSQGREEAVLIDFLDRLDRDRGQWLLRTAPAGVPREAECAQWASKGGGGTRARRCCSRSGPP
jgi:protein tyrosine phosphatase (PTP) superfamily phosphohydrolase (DUF442 family)